RAAAPTTARSSAPVRRSSRSSSTTRSSTRRSPSNRTTGPSPGSSRRTAGCAGCRVRAPERDRDAALLQSSDQMARRPVDPEQSFPDLEQQVLERWRERDVFRESLRRREGAPPWVFYE